MKIIDTLTEEQLSNINKLIKIYSKDNEFEISVFSSKETSSDLLTLEKFNNLNSILTILSNKNKDEKYKKKEETTLDVILSVRGIDNQSRVNFRITISGLDKINEYMGLLHSRKNHLVFGVLVNFMMDKSIDSKDKQFLSIIKKTKNFSNYVVLEDIYTKFKLDLEEQLTEDEMKRLLKVSKNFDANSYDILYRFKERSSYFILKDKNVFRIDLTKTRTSTIINKIDSSPYNYEIEIESEISDKSKFLDDSFDVVQFV